MLPTAVRRERVHAGSRGVRAGYVAGRNRRRAFGAVVVAIGVPHLARELGVFDDLRFLGKQEPIEEILSIADIFLLPSGSETFGLAALEAMSCAVPVVATNIGGLPELIIHAETGLLFPLGEVEAFTNQTRALLDNEDLRLKMADASRTRAVDSFDTQRIVPIYESYYEAVRENVLSSPLTIQG